MIPRKALTTARHAHRTKDWAELAGCGLAHPLLETGRQGQPEPEGGNRGPREASYNKLQADFLANQDFLGFWMVDIRQEGRSQRSASEKREDVPVVHPENQAAGMGEGISHSLQLGATTCTKYLVTWAAQTWDWCKTQSQPSLGLCGVPENLNLSGLNLASECKLGPASDSSRQSNLESEQCRLGKHTHREQGQTQCGWITVNTRQWYLFAVYLPPQSMTEQASLKRSDHHCIPCVRAEIRHWRYQQTEEANINRGNHFGSDRCNRLKPFS